MTLRKEKYPFQQYYNQLHTVNGKTYIDASECWIKQAVKYCKVDSGQSYFSKPVKNKSDDFPTTVLHIILNKKNTAHMSLQKKNGIYLIEVPSTVFSALSLQEEAIETTGISIYPFLSKQDKQLSNDKVLFEVDTKTFQFKRKIRDYSLEVLNKQKPEKFHVVEIYQWKAPFKGDIQVPEDVKQKANK